jgi:hypothetical protein
MQTAFQHPVAPDAGRRFGLPGPASRQNMAGLARGKRAAWRRLNLRLAITGRAIPNIRQKAVDGMRPG